MVWVTGTRTSEKPEAAGAHGVAAEQFIRPHLFDARRLPVDQHAGDAAPALGRISLEIDRENIGPVGVGDPGLLAIDHPIVAVSDADGSKVGGIAARLRFGQEERADGFRPAACVEIGVVQRLGPVGGERAAEIVVHDQGECRGQIRIGEVLHDLGHGGDAEPVAAHVARRQETAEAGIRRVAQHVAGHGAFMLPGCGIRCDHIAGECFGRLDDGAFLGGEIQIRHPDLCSWVEIIAPEPCVRATGDTTV